jgi:hypothetical protein
MKAGASENALICDKTAIESADQIRLDKYRPAQCKSMTPPGANRPPAVMPVADCLELDLFSHIQRVIHLDPEISDCALQLHVTEEDLHGAKVAGLAVDQGRLGTTH